MKGNIQPTFTLLSLCSFSWECFLAKRKQDSRNNNFNWYRGSLQWWLHLVAFTQRYQHGLWQCSSSGESGGNDPTAASSWASCTGGISWKQGWKCIPVTCSGSWGRSVQDLWSSGSVYAWEFGFALFGEGWAQPAASPLAQITIPSSSWLNTIFSLESG